MIGYVKDYSNATDEGLSDELQAINLTLGFTSGAYRELLEARKRAVLDETSRRNVTTYQDLFSADVARREARDRRMCHHKSNPIDDAPRRTRPVFGPVVEVPNMPGQPADHYEGA